MDSPPGSNPAGMPAEAAMSLEHSHPMLLCILALVAWVMVCVLMFWPFSLKRVTDRMPFVVCFGNLPLELAVMVSPKGFRGVFEGLLGHSIYAKRFETDWQWINRWEMVSGKLFFWLTVVGGLWAIVNLCRRRAWISNLLAVIVTLLLYYFRTRFGV